MITTLTQCPVPSRTMQSDQTSVGNYFVSNYPPYSCWNSDHVANFLETLSRGPGQGPVDLYVHLPFCRRRCQHCSYRVYPARRPEDVDLYIDCVLQELSMYGSYPALRDRAFGSVYIGGGSPTYLDQEQIRRLLGGLQERSAWDAVEECTFECEPGTVTFEKMLTLKALSVTRLSMGFQTLNDEILRRNGRDVTVADCVKAFHTARESGFDEINIDLIAGLPGETDSTWSQTIDQVLALAPDSVTIYQLELAYNSGLHASIKSGRDVPLPSWSQKRKWAAEAFRMCEESGYVMGSGYMAIRHPQWWRFVYTIEHYWHGADLVGLGESAFGHIQGIHCQNADTFDAYVNALRGGHLPIQRALELRPEERLRREVILQLKTGCLNAGYFREKYHVELADHFERQFQKLARQRLVEIDDDTIQLTRKGLIRVDALLPEFYLPEHVGVRYT